MTPDEQVARFLDTLERVPEIAGRPEFGMVKMGLLMFPADQVAEFIDWLAGAWQKTKEEASDG